MKRNKPIQISIPKPCSEDWSKMTPQEQGRFCDSCQKCVVDFTSASDKELYQHFSTNDNTCGRFYKSQLDRPIYKPSTRKSYYKWFMNLGFILFLSELLGTEAKAQEPVQKVEQHLNITSNNSVDSSIVITPQKKQDSVTSNVDRREIMIGGGIPSGTILYIGGKRADGHKDKPTSFLRRTWHKMKHPFK